MTKIVMPIRATSINNVSLLELDADPLADTYAVIDRNNFKTIQFGLVPDQGVIKAILPIQYGVNADAMVCIIDSDRAYNAKIVDGVKMQMIDLNTVNLA